MTTGPRGKFAKSLTQMMIGSKDEAFGAANMTADKQLQIQVRLFNAETEAMIGSLADTEPVTDQLEGLIYRITSYEQKRFKPAFTIHLIEFEAGWETISIQGLRKTIEQQVIHFGYPKTHLVSHISYSIHGMGSRDNFTLIFLTSYISPI
jgi:hypothetical protein